jgi:hypothetical protein
VLWVWTTTALAPEMGEYHQPMPWYPEEEDTVLWVWTTTALAPEMGEECQYMP